MKNHDPMYGDNTAGDCCGRVFDVRNESHEVIDDKWICDNCWSMAQMEGANENVT